MIDILIFTFKSAVALFWGWVGISVIVALCAGAVGVFFPLLRRLALEVVVGALAFTAVATHYFVEGTTNGRYLTRVEIMEANERETELGDKAGVDAEHTVVSQPPSERVFRDDPRNRNNWAH